MRRITGAPGMDRFLAGKMPDEIVHSALEKVLLGDTHAKKGRKLSVKNRQSTAAFALCVMGIINSQLSNAINAAEASFLHLPLGDAETERGTVDVPGAIDPGQLLEQRDTKRELFARLREQAGPELHPIVDDWEPNYPGDFIARGGFDRRQVHRVRLLARAILVDLARELPLQAPTGMEMLM